MGKTVGEVMSREVVTLNEEDNLEMVAAGLERFRFHHLPVVDGRKLVGMVSQRDMLRATVAGMDTSAVARQREKRFLESTFVRDIMKTKLVTAHPDEPVTLAARRMLETRYGAMPVVNREGELLGIITENDVVRLASQML
jgi:CBS domain-containing protein